MILIIHRIGEESQTYILTIGDNKAGDYTCKVTIGGAASAESSAETISTTGFTFRLL